MEFKINDKDLIAYAATVKKLSTAIKPIVAKTLNKQAYEMKLSDIPNALDDAFTIRDEKFMHRQIRYKKAPLTANPETNYSEVGSIATARFTGWEEQQFGKKSKTERVTTQAARVDEQWKKQMKPGARMKPGAPFRRTSDYHGPRLKRKSQRTWAMLFESRKQGLNFVIQKTDSRPGRLFKLVPGLYGWVGKKLLRLQKFGTKYDPKRTDWRGNAVKRLVKRRGNFEAIFNKELQKVLKEYKGGA